MIDSNKACRASAECGAIVLVAEPEKLTWWVLSLLPQPDFEMVRTSHRAVPALIAARSWGSSALRNVSSSLRQLGSEFKADRLARIGRA